MKNGGCLQNLKVSTSIKRIYLNRASLKYDIELLILLLQVGMMTLENLDQL